MAKEVYLYSSIYDYTAEIFLREMEAAKGSDIIARINSDGGSVEAGWGAVAKFAEHTKNKTVKVDGKANSMALFFLAYATDAEALDVSTGVLHRAGYSKWFEENPEYMTAERWASLAKTNEKLRAALEAKIDVNKFAQLKGVTLDQVFATPSRVAVELSADDMLKIGLINRINKITPQIKAEIETRVYDIAAKTYGITKAAETITSQNQNYNTMTLQELKASNPKLYAEILQEGVAQERDRVEACLVYLEVDPKGVKAAIEGGKPLSAKQMAEFSLKQNSPEALKKLAAESTTAPVTEEVKDKKTAEEKKYVPPHMRPPPPMPPNRRVWFLTTDGHQIEMASGKGRKKVDVDKLKSFTWEGAETWYSIEYFNQPEAAK